MNLATSHVNHHRYSLTMWPWRDADGTGQYGGAALMVGNMIEALIALAAAPGDVGRAIDGEH
jgi:hypothetical protein